MAPPTRQIALPGFEVEEEGSDAVANCPHPNPLPEGEGTENPTPSPQSPAPSLAGKAVWVIDAHSLIHQVFHALPEMRSPGGEPVNAVFGFTRDLFYLLQEKRPDYLVCAFDLPGATFRHAMYDQYKIQRAEMPNELRPQIPAIRRVLDVLGIPALGCESYEADDILATMARLTEAAGGRCVLVTNDKDARQLITDKVVVFSIRKNEVLDAATVAREWGITPSQVVDYQALVGDSVDNVPGVPLIGPKFAKQLIEQYGTLDAILEHAGEVAGTKRRENLLKYRDQALMSRDLVRLDAKAPIAIDWQAGRAGRFHREAALRLFDEFGFRTMGQKLDAVIAALDADRPC